MFTADDLNLITQPSVEGVTPVEISRPPLAQGSVAYVGEAVAAVVADSEAIAADACELVEVDYEPMPPLSNLASATDEDAPILHPRHEFQHRARRPVRHIPLQSMPLSNTPT